MRCTVCPTTHVPNSIFCNECGVYLLKQKELGTDPLDIRQLKWLGRATDAHGKNTDPLNTRPVTVRLRIASPTENNSQARELQISLVRSIRLGRTDPTHDIFPEVDFTQDLGREHGVSRMHACIYQQGNVVMMEDLGSTNGTLLNGKRLDPYMSETLGDGDQFQMGELLVEVRLES